MSASESILNPERIFQALVEAGNDWADKNAAADLLEETKRTVMAGIMQDGEGSIAAREAFALSSSTYGEHLEQMTEARRLANRAKVKYDSLKTLAELRRSEESTRRTEMRLT